LYLCDYRDSVRGPHVVAPEEGRLVNKRAAHHATRVLGFILLVGLVVIVGAWIIGGLFHLLGDGVAAFVLIMVGIFGLIWIAAYMGEKSEDG
jgi:hypothetical protein